VVCRKQQPCAQSASANDEGSASSGWMDGLGQDRASSKRRRLAKKLKIYQFRFHAKPTDASS